MKEVSENTKINRNVLYLVRGLVSDFYEEMLDHQTKKLEEAYEQNQRDSILIDTLKANLAVAKKMISTLFDKSNRTNNSAEQEPIVIEDNDITILSTRKGSISTIAINDTEERITIANAESSYVMPNNDQQPNQEGDNMEIESPSLTKEVRNPDTSSKTKKLKKKDFTSHIITGHTVLPKLKENIHDIILYDIPGNWNAEKVTEEINKNLGSLLKATLMKQGKYYCVQAQVVLRTRILAELEAQRWQVILGGQMVRWFPGDWILSTVSPLYSEPRYSE
ncbi:hypothetical protein C1645_839711 [Glomus cerebriforme]|uniref:Uncharacterized protein n=1 Tax=Glomus cerebriforme TaxID=658196 RepID=A0A397S587_9GLOM|nr:hypothetical protein C1645_839711 [Glomus cerebriforme]